MNYLFNLSEPLVIPRKKISTFVETGLCIAYLWICWDMLSERLVYWIPVGLFLYLLVKGIRHWHCVIQISEQGITTPKGKVLLWNKILYCQYVVVYGRYSHVELFLRTSQNYNETIHLNDYLWLPLHFTPEGRWNWKVKKNFNTKLHYRNHIFNSG